MSKTTKIAAAVVATAFAFVAITYSYVNGVRGTAVEMETQLSAQYLDNQNELSSFISTFYEQLGIADRKSERLEEVLVDAVKGRYDRSDSDTTAQPGGGALFSAISEAYPDLSGLDTYDEVAATVRSGREAYKAKQTKLLDMIRTYQTWRERSLFRKMAAGMIGVPTSNLEARIGDDVVTGESALTQMRRIVTTSSTKKAYTDGELEPLTPTTKASAG